MIDYLFTVFGCLCARWAGYLFLICIIVNGGKPFPIPYPDPTTVIKISFLIAACFTIAAEMPKMHKKFKQDEDRQKM